MKSLTVIFLSLILTIFATNLSAQAQEVPETSVTPIEAPAPAESIEVMAPANPKPMQDFTQYFAQRTATVTSGDKKVGLTYFWFPAEKPWAENAKFPLILVLHDPSGFAEAGRHLITESVRKKHPAFIVVPALPEGKRWADPGTLKPVHALPETVELIRQLQVENPAIDSSRIYVIGCGTGGNGTYGAVQLYPDIFAAAVPITATWNPNETSNMKDTPIAAFHGENDKIVPYAASSDTISMVKHQGNNNTFFTKITRLGNDCASSQLYTAQLWDWLFKQVKK